MKIGMNYDPRSNLTLCHGDAEDFIASLPLRSVDLVITSPPYNLGKEYEGKASLAQYIGQQEIVIERLDRVLSDTGSICWQVGNYIQGGEVFPLDIYYYDVFKSLGYKLRNRIVWAFGHGLHASKRFSGRYETLLWFTKSDKYTFNLDSVRVPSKYPGKRHYKGPNAGKLSGNPLGKNPSDMWEFMAREWEAGIWDIPNVKSNHPEKTLHPCQFPVELAERCVLAFSNEGDLVLDPYAGVGTTLIAGVMHNRRVVGSEKELVFVDIAKQRLSDYFDGKLKTRPVGKPIHRPSGKLSERPKEWDQ